MEIFLLGYMIWTEWKDTKRHRAWMARASAREREMLRIIEAARAAKG